MESKRLQRKPTKKEKNASEYLHTLTDHLFKSKDYRVFSGDHYYLENHWTDVINVSVYTPLKLKSQQSAIWEFLQTERNYINKLRIINEVFLQSFKLIQSEGMLQGIHQEDIFGNIPEVLLANDTFWLGHNKVLRNARDSKRPILPSELLSGLIYFEKTFAPYMQFCILQKRCLGNIRFLEDPDCKTDLGINFRKWLQWAENLPQCGKQLTLVNLMTEPMQRLTRYPLLLKKILSETVDEDERRKLEPMVRNADNYAYKVNKTVGLEDEKEKLFACLEEFEYYSIMDAGYEEVKWIALDFLRLDIQGLPVKEPRCVLKRGSMKIIEKKGKSELAVEVLLFSDLIVIAKLRRNTSKLTIIRQLYYLDKVKALKSQSSDSGIVIVYLDEAGLVATTFVLEVNIQERDIWVITIEKAKKIYEKAQNGLGSTYDYFQEDGGNKNDSEQRAGFMKYGGQYESIPECNFYPSSDPSNLLNIPFDNHSLNLDDVNNLPYGGMPEDKTASWVMTNKDKRGSIPSDISCEKCRIGESFKSNKSDSDIIHSPDSGVSIRTCSSVPEIANVSKYKKVFHCMDSSSVSGEMVEEVFEEQEFSNSKVGSIHDRELSQRLIEKKYSLHRNDIRNVDKSTQTDIENGINYFPDNSTINSLSIK